MTTSISVENIPNRQENPVVDMEAPGGRSKQVQKETEYVRMLREELAVTGMRGGMLPRGMQSGTSIIESEDVKHAMATIIERAQGLEPSYAEAKRHPDWPKWEEAIHKELKGLNNSGTWQLAKCPPNMNVVDLKWVFRIKKSAAGEIDKYKARLVARGFTQIYGVDYYVLRFFYLLFPTHFPSILFACSSLMLIISCLHSYFFLQTFFSFMRSLTVYA